ncbi:MAG: ABC transporter permease [Chloracidobacterium sp.]|nr:ABC transporter permease [Chloracidobacterium sp.]
MLASATEEESTAPDWKPETGRRLQNLHIAPTREAAIVEELAQYLDDYYAESLASGATEAEVYRQALTELDGSELLTHELPRTERQVTREPIAPGNNRRTNMIADLWQDLRLGARMLMKKPGFTLIASLTLALGVGANTAIFSVVNALLLRPLPFVEAGRLTLLAERSRDFERESVPYPNFEDWRTRARSFEGMAMSGPESFNLTGVDNPRRLSGRRVNWNFFALLGAQPQLGRLFTEQDDLYGASRTVVISHGFWRRQFGGAADVIGKAVSLTDATYTVIGVTPPGFEYFEAADVYVPIGLFLAPKSGLADRGSSFGGSYAVARLKPGVTIEQANSEMASLARQLEQEYPKVNGGKSARAERLQDVMSEKVRRSLWVLLGAVGFILLIACINVANLLLARAAEREKELAVRLALGAGRWRVARQLLSESLLLAGLGAAGGLLLGRWMLAGLLQLAPPGIPQLSRVGLDKDVLLFTLSLAALASLLFGMAPALRASKTDLQTALKDGGRLTNGSAREGMRRALLIAEVGLSLALLAGAGLLLRSMYNLLHVDLGFDAGNLLTMRFELSDKKYNPQTGRVFYDECLARVLAAPGARSAALSQSLPIEGAYWDTLFTVADKPAPSRADLPWSDYLQVSANYFETMGLRLLRGRWFNASDTPESAPVTVINETLARRIWPNEDPIGKRIKQGLPEYNGLWREVIGVVNDVQTNGVDRPTTMQMYALLSQNPGTFLALIVRAQGDPLAVAASIEQAIHTVDKDLPVFAVQTVDQLLGNSLAERRLTLVLLSSFAALALLLAVVGVYGVIAYTVRQRARELGIRMALGAQAGDALKLILAQGLKLALTGVALGIAAAFALTRWMESLLFRVRPADPLVFGVVALVLLLAVICACWVPARRATKVDPLVALRCE